MRERERERERERQRERQRDRTETLFGCLPWGCLPWAHLSQGSIPQPRHVLRLGVKPATFGVWEDDAPTSGVTWTRQTFIFDALSPLFQFL